MCNYSTYSIRTLTSVLRPEVDGGVGPEAAEVLGRQRDHVRGVLLQVAQSVVLKENYIISLYWVHVSSLFQITIREMRQKKKERTWNQVFRRVSKKKEEERGGGLGWVGLSLFSPNSSHRKKKFFFSFFSPPVVPKGIAYISLDVKPHVKKIEVFFPFLIFFFLT